MEKRRQNAGSRTPAMWSGYARLNLAVVGCLELRGFEGVERSCELSWSKTNDSNEWTMLKHERMERNRSGNEKTRRAAIFRASRRQTEQKKSTRSEEEEEALHGPH